jgi:hypothetical protein
MNNLKTFFEDQKTNQNDAGIRLALMEIAERGDEEEWLSTVSSLNGRGEEELPKHATGDTQRLEKKNFDEMVNLALERLAKVSGKRR